MNQREKGIIYKLIKKARSKATHSCYNPNCSNSPIRSHVFQENGVLSHIASNNKVIQLENAFFPETYYQFSEKSTSQGDVITFWGFCSRCDHQIFLNIESPHIKDYSDYKIQLLFSYRGFLKELDKLETNLRIYSLIFQNKDLSKSVIDEFTLKNQFYSLVTKHTYYYKRLFENEIIHNLPEKHFDFFTYELPKVPIAASGSYNVPVKVRTSDEEIKNFDPYSPDFKGLVPYMFFNLIPTQNSTILIIGNTKKEYVRHFYEITMPESNNCELLLKYVSDMLIKYIETWVMSPDLYKKLKTNNRNNLIIEMIDKYIGPDEKVKKVDFNLFEGLGYCSPHQ